MTQSTLAQRLLVPVLTGFALIVLLVGAVMYHEHEILVETEWNRKMDTVADAAVGVVEHLDRLSSIQRLVTHLAADPDVENLYVIDLEDQRVVASSSRAVLDEKLDALPPGTLNDETLRACRTLSREKTQTLTPDGLLVRYVPLEMAYLESSKQIPKKGCAVVILRRGNEIRTALRTTLTLGLVISSLLGLFLVVVLRAVRYRISEPLEELANQVYATGGDGAISANDRLGSEIRGLAEAYNATLSGIRSRQAVYQAQSMAFQAALRGGPLGEILEPLTMAVPKIFGGDARCAIFEFDENGGVARLLSGMSTEFEAAVRELPGNGEPFDIGQAYLAGQAVFVDDIMAEPRWRTWKRLAEEFGFRGYWSVPVHGTDGKASAVLSLFWPERREPDDEQMQLLGFMQTTTALLLDNARQQRARVDAVRTTAESQERFRVLFNESPDPYLVISADDARILDCNPATERILRCSKDAIIGRTVVDFSPPLQADGRPSDEAARVTMERIIAQGSHGFEWLHMRADGEFFSVMVACAASRLAGEKVVLVGWRDMTERMASELKLRQSERQLTTALRLARAGSWTYDVDTDEFTFDDNFYRIFRTTAEQVGGYRMKSADYVEQFIPVSIRKTIEKEFEAGLKRDPGLPPKEIEHAFLFSNGELGWLRLLYGTVADESGRIVHVFGMTQDMTEDKRAEEKLRESEVRYRTLFEETEDGVVLIDKRTLGFVDFNDSVCRMLGYDHDEFARLRIPDLEMQENEEETSKRLESLIEDGPLSFETRQRKKSGESIDLEVRASPVRLQDRDYVLASWRDITERKRRAEAISQARDFYLSLLANAPALVWRADTEGKCNWFNQTWLNFTGRSIDQEMGDGWAEGVHPDDFDRCLQVYRESLLRRASFEMEYRLKHHSGEYRWIMDFGVPIHNLNGEYEGYLGYCYDITERKQAEATLRQFKSTLDATHDCVFMFDPNTLQFFYVNQGACEQVGHSEAELLKMHPCDIMPEFPEAKFRRLIQPLIEGKEQSLRIETVHRHKDGYEVPVEVFVQLIAPPGEPSRFVNIVTDITERKFLQKTLRKERDQLDLTVRQRTADLERAKDEAESATRSKSEFLANMSHEVRSPLTAVLGYADLLMDPDLPVEMATQAVQAIRRNGTHLLAILNDILDLSKIEAGRIDIENVACSPWQLVHEVDSLLKVRAEECNVTIRSIPREPLPAAVLMDPTRVRQVLLNLVSNAVKFSEPGDTVSITLGVGPLNDTGRDVMTIEVQDEGIGMTNEQLNHIFKPFRQADTSTTRKYGGTGLGLSITQRMVELMQGEIEVRSEFGVGSVFTVRLPVTVADESEIAARPETVLGESATKELPAAAVSTDKLEGRVLLAEDSEDIRRFISFMLKRRGLMPEVVVNGLEAFEAALKRPYDLILMDMQMPVMDGYAATQALRKRGYRLPIVALTAHSMSEDRDKCLSVGCDDYLSKPVNEAILTETVARYLNLKSRASTN